MRYLIPARLRMRWAWERRARRNAMSAVADFREAWHDRDEFFATGRDDVFLFLKDTDWGATSRQSLLEIGCGVGRMTRAFAQRFAHVTGLDISPTMIRRAQALNDDVSNITFHVGSGVDLSGFEDQSFDCVVSYIVFQHLPEPRLVYGYIREALRVLRPGGHFRFQARNDHSHRRPDTYNGASIEVEDVHRIAEQAGRKLVSVTGEGTQYCYFEID